MPALPPLTAAEAGAAGALAALAVGIGVLPAVLVALLDGTTAAWRTFHDRRADDGRCMDLGAVAPEMVLAGSALALVPVAGWVRGRWRRLPAAPSRSSPCSSRWA